MDSSNQNYGASHPQRGTSQDNHRIDLNNFIPDPNKRHELKRRLYDSGISSIPMPSVKRQIEENISSRPYSAKMNPNKIQSLSPLKKKMDNITKNIYSNLQDSYKEAAAQEAKYKGEGTAEYYKAQHIVVPPPQIFQGPKKGTRLVPKITQTNEAPVLEGISSTNRILLNRGPRPGQLPTLGRTSQIGSQVQNTLDPQLRLLQGPPAIAFAGFEGGYSLNQKNLEMARSKYLLDKLTGKLPPELRGGKGTKLPPLSESRDAISRGSMSKKSLEQLEDDEKVEEEIKKDLAQQKWQSLDKYIELLLESKSEEETVFVYLNPDKNGDPYNLQTCTYQEREPQKYYTLSGKGLTLYENDTPVEFLSLGQWLIERDSYNNIKELDFFKKFKKWKFMRMWKKTIKHQNRQRAQNSLEEKLFILQPKFSEHLVKHRGYMIEMEKQRFIDTLVTGDTKNIDEFEKAQGDRNDQIKDEIVKISNRCRENIRECISEVVSALRFSILEEIAVDDDKKKTNPMGQSHNSVTMKRKASSNVFEQLGFPAEGMSYGHRATLRKECSRFLRFAYLVDFLSLEALANIYTGSVRDMIQRLEDLDINCDMAEVMKANYGEQNQGAGPGRGKEPLFYVESKLNDNIPIPDSEIHQIQIDDFVLPPRGTSKTEDFDPLVHLELEVPVEEDEDEEGEGNKEDDSKIVPLFQKKVPNIEKYWLKLEPNDGQFIEIIIRQFGKGLENIKYFERWSKHSDLVPYANALEDWDEKVGDNWEEPDSLYLDPKTWIQEDQLYLEQKDMVTKIITSAYTKSREFLTKFAPLLEIYWRTKQVDLKILINEELKNPIDGIKNTLRLFKYHQDLFQSRLPSNADIGLIQLDLDKFRSKIQPTPKEYIQILEKMIPEAIKLRNQECKQQLQMHIKNLDKPSLPSVEDFVAQTNYYNNAVDTFQGIRDRVDMIGQIYNVFADPEFQLKVKKEDKDAYNESLTLISKLSGILENVLSQQEGNKEKFKKDLMELIPKLEEEVNEHFERIQDPKFLNGENMEKMAEILADLNEIEDRFKSLEKTKMKYNSWQEVLETQPTPFLQLEDCREQMTLRCLMWRSLNEWQALVEIWNQTPFAKVDAKGIQAQADKFSKNCSRIEKSLDPNPIQERLKNLVVTFKDAMPIVTALRNNYLEENHWDEIKTLINQTELNVKDENFTLKALIDMNVNQYQEQITTISTKATQEANLKAELDDINEVWKKVRFITEELPQNNCRILKGFDDLFQVLDDSLARINMILGSRFVKPMREKAEQWRGYIMTISDMVDEWILCQKNWRYLYNIFKADDIVKDMPEETKMFMGVDKQFKTLMAKTETQSLPIKMVQQPNFNTLNILRENNKILDHISKSLDAYMEKKRGSFPRFYFLSNDELIDILANSNNLEIVQQHLKTCFDNLVKIDVSEGELSITAMYSSEGEKVPITKTVRAKPPIEGWLLNLQDLGMIDNLKSLMKQGVAAYTEMDRREFVKKHFGQIVAAVAQIMWTRQTETSIEDMSQNPFALEEWHQINETQLQQLTEMIRGDLDSLRRKIVVALVTVDVHARDIVEELKDGAVSSLSDFRWQKQLRYYYDETDDCRIRQVSATLNYGYEYMGATSRLVITPLTDRCWITISNALHIKLGANPAGPAGTGKTESTKDLAKAIAIQCIVFNCSDQVDYLLMAKLFSGLCQQGCWTCLDEFNRIDIEVLSVIAQQLLQVRRALLDGKTQFLFEEKEIRLRPEFGCHVTMNPGYAGRTELPDNLKVMFRPVAMMIPNYGLIAEIMLFAEGFGSAKNLSTKMVQLYKLSSEQLSQQDHYDFGLRAVKSVLVMAGSLKRANPDLVEDAVLIRAMRDANIPKFLKDDIPLFNAIVQDLFPTITIAENDYGKLEQTIKQIIEEKDLQKHQPFVVKVIQLFETFNVRFGVMLVGPTGGGKTTCYEVLQSTMTYLREQGDRNEVFQKVSKIVLNPKSISMGELYGEVNIMTQEWFDGLASKYMRTAAQETGDDKTWIVFDGPVDALWIENMNTVLDDNMTLCLANGQRIKLRPQMRMLFEVQDLAVASPATVSRCGMVYMTIEELGWRPYVNTWLNTYFKNDEGVTEPCIAHLRALFEQSIDPGLEYIRSNCKEPIRTTDLQQVTSICNFLENLIRTSNGFKGTDDEKKKLIDCHFAWSYAWGIGGSLEQNSKDKFDSLIRDIFKTVQIPPSFTVFDYFFEWKREPQFKPWTAIVPNFIYDKEKSYFDLMVPTSDTVKYQHLLETLQEIEKPQFFTGLTGVGKSVVIANTLQKLKDEEKITPIIINMSAQTNSAKTQSTITEKLEKKKRNQRGAKPGLKNIVFIDDINMPSVEQYGAQPPIEFLRLFLDRQGFYERGEWMWYEVIDTTLIACAAPPSGGRANLTPRLTRRFNMFCLPEASSGTLQTIFSSILRGFLSSGFADKVKTLDDAAINSTIEIYNKIQIDLRPTPAKFHYLFNLRDVSKVVQGICMTKPISIPNEDIFMKLWANECFRVFHDRLINESDREWFRVLILELIVKNFRLNIERDDLLSALKFGDLLKLDSPVQYYEPILDRNKLLKTLHGGLDDYNMSNSNKMNLVLFDDAIDHILRIGRCLKQPRGHIMLIGVGGSGKQSLIRLGTFMRQMMFTQIELTKGFNNDSFLEYMKGLMKQAGIEGKGISFVMTDTQIISETFIENLNNLLNTGEIPNLMVEEDKNEILNGVRPICVEKKIIDTVDNINALFISRVRESLHICLCMSPVGETLRIRCRQFPSLVNCCTLDWFDRWPEQALLFVSSEFLKTLPDTTDVVKQGLSEMCMKIHTSVEAMADKFYESLRRRVYTTPKSYLDLISLYIKMLEEKRNELQVNKNRLSQGLKKLNDTNANIAQLKVSMAEMQPKLVKANEEIKVSLERVNADKEIADQKEKVVSAEAEIVNKKAGEAKAIQDDAETDLAKAKPELEAAVRALKDLDKNMINEVKNLGKPPDAVNMVVQCVAILLGRKEINQKSEWSVTKQVMGDINQFMKQLQEFQPEDPGEKAWKKAREGYINRDDFDPAIIKGKSVAAAVLANWCKSCSNYAEVTAKVAPKKAKLAEVQVVVKQLQSELDVKNRELQKVKDAVAELQANCERMMKEKAELEFTLDRDKNRMVRAEKLVVLLADEGVRWKTTVENIQGDIERLVGNVFIACACISYFGAFTGQYREMLVEQWVTGCLEKSIPTSQDFSLVTTLGDPVVIRSWNIAGLPNDKVSLENGILARKAQRYALCIDPQQQANRWIKNMEKNSGLVLLKFGNPLLLREMTAAVRNGLCVLVEDVEEYIDPAIDPVLLKQAFKSDAGLMQIKLGENLVDYDDNFNFFMTSKMPNPHYIPEICIKVTLINFTVTMDGLQQQLLGDVVIAEKPEEEQKRDQIVLTMAADAKTLKDLENNILKLLSEATIEEILDQDKLIVILEDSKKTSGEINERMELSRIIEVEINQTRSLYNSVAIRGSVLYFVIADLGRIDPMYQNSLSYVKSLFNKAIQQSAQADTIDQRLDNLIDTITRMIYTNISRGLFENDKIIYSFLISTSIKRQAQLIDEAIWNILLRGPTIMTPEEVAGKPKNPNNEQIPELLWDTLYSAELRSKGQFEGLTQHISMNWKEWEQWKSNDNPFLCPLPGQFQETLSDFDKLILVKCLRFALVRRSFAEYILKDMGQFFVESPSVSMDILYADLSIQTPLIFVLSQGADPTSQLLKFAQERQFSEKLFQISLGQGQGIKAEAFIRDGCRDGNWVMLQNCHLARSWMPSLEKIVLNFSEVKDQIHPDFRLFLTSMPADYFPVSVLQNSVKLTTEPPRGIRANLKRTYQSISQEFVDDCQKPETWRKLLFSLSFFHAAIQERRKFGPLGWNIRYEFNDSDLETSFTMLKLFLDSPQPIPWDALLFVTGHINYGGRVTDDLDRRCLLTILEKYCQPDVLKDGYKFTPSGTYFAPPDGKISIYRDYIEKLPLNDPPEVFGLNENANINFNEQESSRVIDTILSIQPRLSTAGGGMTPDQIVLEKAKEILEGLPDTLEKKTGLKDLFHMNEQGLIPSLSTVLLQEMEKFNRLMNVMRRSLVDIDLAIKGFIVMSDTLDKMYLKLQNNQVPANWAEVAYPSLKPLSSWFKDFVERIQFMRDWLQNGNPVSYWMPGMFYPQGFMTGVLQTHSRQYKIAIDKLGFTFEILTAEKAEELEEKPEDGVYIHGLYMDGARFERDTMTIADQYPGKMFDTMPVIWFKPVEDYKPDPEDYQAPLYKTSVRAGVLSTTGQSTNFILNVSIPTKEAPSLWVQRAAALLCMLND